MTAFERKYRRSADVAISIMRFPGVSASSSATRAQMEASGRHSSCVVLALLQPRVLLPQHRGGDDGISPVVSEGHGAGYGALSEARYPARFDETDDAMQEVASGPTGRFTPKAGPS